ncbi:Uncharacterized protein family UPF0497, trans-membrane plant [Cynara cardunculus var. scolymus]|uniref:CASP-like protein n=1 Tax=Cynara cardunculus var. scolymus TaxID=59895 RepID=A0A103YIQ2_CYNCS|nr:Uncharacterized protein family UPF0497, trans-membrane plant [Cynara cardunculus var. scolymus]
MDWGSFFLYNWNWGKVVIITQSQSDMKSLFGSPGNPTGLLLRMGQCLFAAASLALMASASGFSTATSFWLKKDLHNHIFLSLLVVGDWVTAILSLAAACSSAGVMVLFVKDTDICRSHNLLSCNTFQISIALAFVAWFLLAVSSYVMFWLLATI